LIAHEHVKSIVINMEHAAFDQGLAQQLADHLKSPCYSLSELKAESLYHTVREEMGKPVEAKVRRKIREKDIRDCPVRDNLGCRLFA